jgi:hypothetical protein
MGRVSDGFFDFSGRPASVEVIGNRVRIVGFWRTNGTSASSVAGLATDKAGASTNAW